MKQVFIGAFLCLMFLSGAAMAKEKVLTADDVNCNADGTYCEREGGRPFTGQVSRYNGEEKMLSTYQSGRLSGLTTVWNAEGKIASKTYYKNGKKNGVEKIFYNNRTIKSFAEYKDGYLHGKVEYYTEKGKLKGRLSYKNGYFEKGYCVVGRQKQEIRAARTTEIMTCGD